MTSRWGATHVLSVEREEKMVAQEVRLVGSALFTVLEWTGHEPAEWTLEDGRLCHCGERWDGVASLLPLPKTDRLSLDAVLAVARRQGAKATVQSLADALGRTHAEVLGKVQTLVGLQVLPVLLEMMDHEKLDGEGPRP